MQGPVVQVLGIIVALGESITGVMIPVVGGGIDVTDGVGPVVGSQVLIVGCRQAGYVGPTPDFAVIGIGREAVILPVRVVREGISVEVLSPGLVGVGVITNLRVVFDAEPAGMVGDDVQHDFHVPGMHFVYEILKRSPGRLQSWINAGEVPGMVPVVVQRTAIVYDRRDPDCGKTQVLNVIQLLDEPLEIAPPGYILRIGYGGIDIGIRVVTGPLVGHIVGGGRRQKNG